MRSLIRSQIFYRIGRSYRGKEVMILSPIVRGRKGFHKEVIAGARRLGYRRARIDGELLDLRAPQLTQGLERFKEHDIDIVIGKAKVGGREVEALIDQGLRIGNGVIHLISERGEQIFNQRLFCLQCGIGYEPLDPRLFSFNSRQGACAECGGMGFQWDFDPELLFANPRQSVSEALHNISAFASENGNSLGRSIERLLEELAKKHNVDIDKPFGRLAKKTQDQVLYGSNGRSGFVGFIPFLREISQQGEEDGNQELSELLNESRCNSCHGRRLNSRAQAVRVDGKAIWQLTALSVQEAKDQFNSLQLAHADKGTAERDRAVADKILKEIQQRLTFLAEVGLPYLTLDRRADTLSGGEAQRIRLAAQLGSNLRGVCYVLDEPTIGLRPRDNAMLLRTLRRLEAVGNSVVVVEHDEDTIRHAEHVIDLGPGAGRLGGRVVAQGPAEALTQQPASLTGRFLGRARPRLGPLREVAKNARLRVVGAAEHNLQSIDVEVPI